MAERGGVVSVIIKARDLASSVVGRFRRNLSSISRTARDVTRAIVATGCYGPSGFDPRWDMPVGAQVADGVTGVRRVVREQIASALDLITQQARLSDGSRKITSVTEVVGMEGDTIVLNEIFNRRIR